MVNCTAMQQALYPITPSKLQACRSTSIVPVDAQGNCVQPKHILVEDAFETNSTDDWSFADVGPQESAWRRSSEWPYVMQIASVVEKCKVLHIDV